MYSKSLTLKICSKRLLQLLVIALILFARAAADPTATAAPLPAITASEPQLVGSTSAFSPSIYGAMPPPSQTSTYVDVLEPSDMDIESCSPACLPPQPTDVLLLEWERVTLESDIEEDDGQLLTQDSISTILTFDELPTLPVGATMHDATVVMQGGMFGRTFKYRVTDPNNVNVQFPIPDLIESPGHLSNAGAAGKHNCYNRFYGGDNCQANLIDGIEVEFDIPSEIIESWYEGDPASLRITPVDVNLADETDCDPVTTSIKPHNLFPGEAFAHRYGCTYQSYTSPQLFIRYSAPALSLVERSRSVVPSLAEDNFGRTRHEYDLPIPNPMPEWTALVVSVTDINKTVSASESVGLNIVRGFGQPLLFNTNNAGRAVNAIAIHEKYNADSEARAVVEADNSADPASEYDLHFITPTDHLPNPTPAGATASVEMDIQSAHLFTVNVEPDNNLYFKMTAPQGLDMQWSLFPELPGEGAASSYGQPGDPSAFIPQAPHNIANNKTEYVIRANTMGMAATEQWGLLVTQQRPTCVIPGRANSGVCEDIDFELIACPAGSEYAPRFGVCQTLIYPHPELVGGNVVPATETRLVGNVRIFSEGGFNLNPSDAIYGPGASADYAYCTGNEAKGMPLLGISTDVVPIDINNPPNESLIAVLQGSVCVTDEANPHIEIIGGSNGFGDQFGAMVGPSIRETTIKPVEFYANDVSAYHGRMLVAFGEDSIGKLVQASTNTSLDAHFRFDPDGATVDTLKIDPWGFGGDNPEWPQMNTVGYIDVDDRTASGDDSGSIQVSSEPMTTPIPNMSAMWQVGGDFANQSFDFGITTGTTAPNFEVASLTMRSHAPLDIQATFNEQTLQARISELRILDATIHQDDNMGGAYLPIKAVILPAHTTRLARPVEEGQQQVDSAACGAQSCLDARSPDDIMQVDWDMPDINITENAGRVVLQRDGEMQVFSADHPDSAAIREAMGAQAFSQDFNFKTFSGDVTIDKGTCPIDNDDGEPAEQNVQIIKGTTNLALPSLGDGSSESGAALLASFTLCKNKLRETTLKFQAFPPGIPVGSTGLILTSLEGSVIIRPDDSAKITLAVAFKTADGATLSNIKGTIVIDTRGQFAFIGEAELVGTFDAKGELVVAWNPLDILLGVEVSYMDWFTGSAKFHLWRGQGWGTPTPYPWLPDNNDLHFTGSINAVFTIKEGRIGQFFGVELPRRDLEIGVTVSFGEFCANSDCTEQQWGVQGKLKVGKFTVGVFVGAGIDVKFFVGDRGRTLIDEFDPGRAINGAPAGPVSSLAEGDLMFDAGGIEGACPLNSGVAECTFNVVADTGEALFTIAWSEGNLPTPRLITPNGKDVLAEFGEQIEIDEEYEFDLDGASYALTMDSEGVLFTVENPAEGAWKLTLDNLQGTEYYNALFLANSAEPTFTLTAPNNVVTSGSLDIDWTTDTTDPAAQLHFFYVRDQEYVDLQLMNSVILPNHWPISTTVPVSLTNFTWEPSGLSADTYRVMGRLDHPIHGSIYAYSPGTFTWVDNTPPAVPADLTLHTSSDGTALVASWTRNTEADLSSYQVEYTMPDLDAPGGLADRTLSIPFSDAALAHPTREQLRLVGLHDGTQTTVCVRAIDASGNQSACSAPVNGTPVHTVPSSIETPTMTSLNVGANRSLAASWVVNAIPPHGYLLGWANSCDSSYTGYPATEGTTNLDVGNVLNFTLNGLPAGTYRVSARSYYDNQTVPRYIQQMSDWATPLKVVLTDGVDADASGLPDDWEERFGVTGADNDPDKDFLTNLQEFNNMTDPTRKDSDDDGFWDSEEVNSGGTDPCDAGSTPVAADGMFLVVEHTANGAASEISLDFTVASNETLSAPQGLDIGVYGGGTMNWQATSSESWLVLSSTTGGPLTQEDAEETLNAHVDATGLATGYYEATILITATGDAPVYNAPQEVRVTLWVMRPVARPETAIEGIVFSDDNGNGTRETGEDPVGTVNVYLVSEVGLIIDAQLSADITGEFVFRGVPYAPYRIVVCERDCQRDLMQGGVPVEPTVGQPEVTELEIPYVAAIPTAVQVSNATANAPLPLIWLLVLTVALLTGQFWFWRRADLHRPIAD